jgi:hypothetical protein
MKKLLIGTALASTMFVGSIAAQAETKVSGYYEMNYRAISDQSAGSVDSPNGAFGTEMDINLSSSNELSNGMKLDIFIGTSNEAANATNDVKSFGTDSYGLAVTSGNTTVDISTDRGNTLDMISDVVPNPVDQPMDNIVKSGRLAGAGTAAGSTDAVQANTHITLTQKLDMGTLAFTYMPSTGNSENSVSSARNDGANSGYSGYSAVFSGKVMDGLNIGIGYETVQGYEKQDAKSTTYGANYTSGPISVGIQKNSNDIAIGGTTESTAVNVDGLHYGVTYKVSDALTIGFAIQQFDQSNKTVDEEYKQIEAAYNLGALGVGVSYTTVENAGGTSGADEDQLMIRLSSKL